VQAGKSYRAIGTSEFNCQTSEIPYVIASIEAPLKSAGWQSKFVIFILAQHFFFDFFFCVMLIWRSWFISTLFDRGVSQYFCLELFKCPAGFTFF
jgi:hypothetical protein